MKIKKTISLLIIVLIIFISPVKAENKSGNLKIKLDQHVFNLNPIYAANGSETLISRQIFDTLFTYDLNGNIIPNLAANLEVNNEATVFIINLKENIYFQDYNKNGQKLNKSEKEVSAEDWKWSFEYLAASENKSPYAGLLKKVEGYSTYRQNKKEEISGINILDKYTLKIKLKEPYAPFIYNLTELPLAIIPKEAVKNNNLNFSLNPLGTGAFSLENFNKNKIVLKKNKNYWKSNVQNKNLPYLDKVEFSFSGQLNNIKSFDILKLSTRNYLNYKNNKEKYSGYQHKKIAQNNIYYIAFNTKNNEESTDLFKQQIKEEELIKELNLSDYIPVADLENNYYALKEISSANKENKTFDNDNFKNKTFSIATNNFKTAKKISGFLKDKMVEHNIDLKVNNQNWSKHLKRLQTDNADFDLFLMNYDYKNKFKFLSDNFHSDSLFNYSNYENERVDNLIDYIKLESRNEKRKHAYQVIEDILIETSPHILLLQGIDNYLINNELENSEILDNIYLKDKLELLYFK